MFVNMVLMVLKICLYIWCWKTKILKRHIFEKHLFMFFTWEWAKCIHTWNHPRDDHYLWNLRLSYLNQLWWIIIIEMIRN
jgi:hypothetical protein